jgi:CRISPR-associated protein Csb3
VDVTNPGHFFACCGLLELTDRLWPAAEGWFSQGAFHVRVAGPQVSVPMVVARLRGLRLQPDSPSADDKTCPLRLWDEGPSSDSRPRLPLRLDWWLDKKGVGGALKTWAGQQRITTISRAMLHAAVAGVDSDEQWLNYASVVYDPDGLGKAVEPFYFDARRFAHPLDAGFSLDAQEAETPAHPRVEFLALVGLQRFRPAPTRERWSFEYRTWPVPLRAPVAAAVCDGSVPTRSAAYRFRLLFRDDQKRYKAFGFATRIGGET